MNLKNLPGLGGKANKSGLFQTLLIAPLSAFATIAPADAPDADDGTSVTISTGHTFITGEGFTEMYTTKDSAQMMADMIGERDGYNHNPKVEFFHPGAKADVIAFANKAPYDTFIVLVKTMEGDYIQLGQADMGADVTQANFATGTLSSGRKGYTFTAETFGSPFIYKGGITMKPEPTTTTTTTTV